jgi:hypothetical protein
VPTSASFLEMMDMLNEQLINGSPQHEMDLCRNEIEELIKD